MGAVERAPDRRPALRWVCRSPLDEALERELGLTKTQPAPRVTPIREVLRDNDANYVPDRLGETFTVSGVLISSPVNLRGFGPDATEQAYLVNLQDGTGGIALFTRNTTLLAGGFKGGDAVQARGKLSQHDG